MTDAEAAKLAKLVKYVKGQQDAKVVVTGHTDSGLDAEGRTTLSNERAQAIKAYLKKMGISASRITVVGKADTEPVASNDTAKGRAANRRAEIEITGVK